MAQLFEVDTRTVNEHLKNIFNTKELEEIPTIRKFRIVQKEGGRKINRDIQCYNLDAIIAVGYRVNSKKATQFRIWSTNILRRFIVEGQVLNKPRLEESPEKLVGLYKAIAFLESKSLSGKLKGSITLKLTGELEPTDK
jgi:hypothetical protein